MNSPKLADFVPPLPVQIAQQAGHSPAMMLATYAHVIEELAGTERATGIA